MPRWEATDKEVLREMFEEGCCDKEIAEKLGRTATAVALQRHYLGLHRSKQPGREFEIHDAMAEYYPAWYKKTIKRTMEKTVFDVVSDIQARKEREHIEPPYATYREIKREYGGTVDDGSLHAMLGAEVLNGILFQRRTINGYAYGVSEE